MGSSGDSAVASGPVVRGGSLPQLPMLLRRQLMLFSELVLPLPAAVRNDSIALKGQLMTSPLREYSCDFGI